MALQIVHTVEINQLGNSIVLSDITGADSLANSTKYDGGSGGGSNPNKDRNNYIYELVITTPDGKIYTDTANLNIHIHNLNITASSASVFPQVATTKTYTPAIVGLQSTDAFPDGVYKFEVYQSYLINPSAHYAYAANISLLDMSGITNTDKAGYGSQLYGKYILDETATKTLAQTTSFYNTINDITNVAAVGYEQSLFTYLAKYYPFVTYKTTTYLKVINGLLRCFQPKITKVSIYKAPCCGGCHKSGIDKLKDIFDGIFIIDAQFEAGLYDECNKNIQALNSICNSLGCDC